MPNQILEALPATLRTIASKAVTEYFDNRRENLESIIDLFLNFNGDYTLFSHRQLDEIAYLFGFSTDVFWFSSWDITVKAALLKGVYADPYIWQNNGTRKVLNYVLQTFNIDGRLVLDSGFIVNQDVVGVDLIDSGETYKLLVKDLTESKRVLCQRILKVFFPLGFEIEIVGY
jgi:hypothetical protein